VGYGRGLGATAFFPDRRPSAGESLSSAEGGRVITSRSCRGEVSLAPRPPGSAMTGRSWLGPFPWVNGAPAPGGKDFFDQGDLYLLNADRGMGALPVGSKMFGGGVYDNDC